MADCWKYICLEPGPNCHFQSQWTIDNVINKEEKLW